MPVKVYHKRGGAELVVADGGKVTVQSGGTLEILAGATATGIVAAEAASTTSPGSIEIATDAEAKAGALTNRCVTPANVQAILKDDAETISTAALGTVRKIHGQLTASHAHISGGTIAGVRGLVTLSGAVDAGGAFFYGAQGKLVITGTMDHADSRLTGLIAQIETTGATLTSGQLSGLWVDHGTGISGDGGGQFNMIRITNTVVGSKPNAVIYAHSDATNLFDLSAPGGTMSWLAAAGASANSAGKSDGCAAQKVLIISIGGVPYYIPVFDQNT